MKKSDIRKANCPDLKMNRYTHLQADCHFDGIVDNTMRFVEKKQLLDAGLWKRFAEQFVLHSDDEDAGWRNEYWGKMMRGACFVYSYTKNERLYHILKQTVRDILDTADTYGRISTYSLEKEFAGWDIWGRKYVMLGLQYFLEISEDEGLKDRIMNSMCGQADYIISKIGAKTEGKTPITTATNHWRGLNSSSILEPMVRLYRLTGEKKYFDFAEYIVESGGTAVANIFELAFQNQFAPYQYPITKAYEMTSCFEGLLEFYRLTGEEWYKTALINFADRILECDFTVIGCSGCTSELFDHSTVRQSNTTNGEIMQETCVTVTLMKFFWQMNMLTGNAKYADAFERSFYNAYLGAVNTNDSIEPTIRELLPEAVIEPLPFDSYSPLTAGTRGNGIGGLKLMPDHHYYGCCACIGALGIGLVPKLAFMKFDRGIVVNMYCNGRAELENGTEIITETAYPADGTIRINIRSKTAAPFALRFRNPSWSRKTLLTIPDKGIQAVITDGRMNGQKEQNSCEVSVKDGYIELDSSWEYSQILISFDMRTRAIYPIPYGKEILMNKVIWGQNYMVQTFDQEDPLASKHIALCRGPVVLAVDGALGYAAEGIFFIRVDSDGYVDVRLPEQRKAPYDTILELEVPLSNGEYFRVTDYASAGKIWNNGEKIAAWIRINL